MILYQYSAPTGLLDRTLTIDLVTEDAERTVWEDVVAAGSSVSIPIPVSGPALLKAYVDNVLHEIKEVP